MRVRSSLSGLASLALAVSASAQCPSYTNGPASAGIGSVTGGTYVPMVYIDCLPQISTIEVQFGRVGATVPIDGLPLTLAVWDDPTDDSNPADAVLVATMPITGGITGGHTGRWQSYSVTALRGNPILATGGMFLGVAVSYAPQSGAGPAAIDFASFATGRMWMGAREPSLPGAYDFTNISGNSFLRPVQNLGFPPGNWLIRANPFERAAHACGTTDFATTGSGTLGSNLISTVLAPQGSPLIGYGFANLALPFCNCTVAHEWGIVVAGATSTLPIPSNPNIVGLQVFVQGIDFLAPGGCPNPMFALTDSFAVTIR